MAPLGDCCSHSRVLWSKYSHRQGCLPFLDVYMLLLWCVCLPACSRSRRCGSSERRVVVVTQDWRKQAVPCCFVSPIQPHHPTPPHPTPPPGAGWLAGWLVPWLAGWSLSLPSVFPAQLRGRGKSPKRVSHMCVWTVAFGTLALMTHWNGMVVFSM